MEGERMAGGRVEERERLTGDAFERRAEINGGEMTET